MSVLQKNSRSKLMLGRDGDALFILIIVNVVAFVLLNFVKVLYQVTNSDLAEFSNVLSWFYVPADANVFATRPWTLFTYMFSQIGFWPLLSSMLWLWSFGYILQDLTGTKKIIPIYLYAAFTGAIFFLLTINVIPDLRAKSAAMPALMGALPAVMGIAIATTTISPKYRIFPFIAGGIPIYILTIVFVLITVTTTTHAGYAVAYCAAGITGFLFSWQLQKGNDWSEWMNNFVSWIDGLFNPDKRQHQKAAKQRLYYKAQKEPYKKTPHITQQRIDDLLDKINQKGYSSLNEEEKEFLKKASSEEF